MQFDEPSDDPLVGEIVGLRLESLPSTEEAQRQRRVLANFSAMCGTLHVSKVKPFHAARWLASHPEWKQSTRSTHLSRLRACFNHAKRLGYIERNPIDGYTVPKVRSRVTYFDEETEQLVVASATPALSRLIRVLLATGMRPGEAMSLTADMAKDDGVRIQFTLIEHKSAWRGKRRFVILPPGMVPLFRELMHIYPRGSGEPLLRTTTGKPWRKRNATNQFAALADKLHLHERLMAKFGSHIDPPCLYSCRHTAATRLIARVGLATAAELLGNTVRVLERTYKHIECMQEHLYRAMGY